ncbi:MAG: hypothetical protein COZ34_02685 [Candidatus Pacebacteria bacterium CG_4_10_14_3_um_filter_34_15]|nr:HAD-IA family hydrolase [Candidatus Pacearchaeota archaeon]NCQ66080.1 HAD-IA family hydrolase [Candidatus Paceibacterota bacterium]OIO45223.1 MAG: hypothetical protein AUJ41_00465 [Candidatus Pacebacteria bacterium CG1_02_43_31]PIQ81095.1 MAG: hypothetical protein COV78_02110 [Candidatus Pacebacteria bacterium CG11_big_fil_rev_8_21_14_0_20_34_55]PIX81555.1 MAG: hypothetical protein COZ34_02685 [Candidatus Pacebacteria bacterium CG_4_10_14_3_um_filter_34_15]PJC43942.1 MAG: hypothetical prote
MNNIKFIYFDVGGVLLLDFSNTNKWSKMKSDLGITKDNEKMFDLIWLKYRDKICIDCDIDTIVHELRKTINLSIPNEYSMLEDFVKRFDKNPYMWAAIEIVKQKFKIGLLTNMYPRMLELIQSSKLLPNISWNTIIDSSKVGYQKPDNKIFELAEKLSGVKPEEILFVENTSEHTEAAKQKGWNVFLYDDQNPKISSEKLLEILKLK